MALTALRSQILTNIPLAFTQSLLTRHDSDYTGSIGTIDEDALLDSEFCGSAGLSSTCVQQVDDDNSGDNIERDHLTTSQASFRLEGGAFRIFELDRLPAHLAGSITSARGNLSIAALPTLETFRRNLYVDADATPPAVQIEDTDPPRYWHDPDGWNQSLGSVPVSNFNLALVGFEKGANPGDDVEPVLIGGGVFAELLTAPLFKSTDMTQLVRQYLKHKDDFYAFGFVLLAGTASEIDPVSPGGLDTMRAIRDRMIDYNISPYKVLESDDFPVPGSPPGGTDWVYWVGTITNYKLSWAVPSVGMIKVNIGGVTALGADLQYVELPKQA